MVIYKYSRLPGESIVGKKIYLTIRLVGKKFGFFLRVRLVLGESVTTRSE